MKKFCVIGILLFFIYFLLGCSTYYWPKANGILTSDTIKSQTVPGYRSVQRPGVPVYEGGWNKWNSITYTYRVGSDTYYNSFIGFYLPAGLKFSSLENQFDVINYYSSRPQIVIRYLPFAPGFSVAKSGPDLRLFFVAIAFFSGLLYLRSYFLKVAKDNA